MDIYRLAIIKVIIVYLMLDLIDVHGFHIQHLVFLTHRLTCFQNISIVNLHKIEKNEKLENSHVIIGVL